MSRVNYDVAAEVYESGRSLSAEVLEQWRRVVEPLLSGRRPFRVLDLGSGTGIFTRAWPAWGAASVVAVEPSAAMWVQARRAGIPGRAAGVRGWAEKLPLRANVVDVAWLSTVLHHVDDLASCATELARVLTPDGRVLIRGLFADHGGGQGWLRFFPAANRAVATFPSSGNVIDTFGESGLLPLALVDVDEPAAATTAEASSWVRRMRHADTLLAAFTDTEIEDACRAMEASGPHEPLAPTRFTLLALYRQ